MQSVTIRKGQTSSGIMAFSPFVHEEYSYVEIKFGSNPISKLEIVSALNSFNISILMYEYYYGNRTQKYNPKIYLSAVQSVSKGWNGDAQSGQNWNEKSGSLILFKF